MSTMEIATNDRGGDSIRVVHSEMREAALQAASDANGGYIGPKLVKVVDSAIRSILSEKRSEAKMTQDMRDAFSLFEGEYLTDGEGHAPSDVYRGVRAEFIAGWELGGGDKAILFAVEKYRSMTKVLR